MLKPKLFKRVNCPAIVIAAFDKAIKTKGSSFTDLMVK
jgi:hypothetical protein